MAQRSRLLWHPLSIVAGAGIVSVVISVLGDLPFNSGRAGVPAMLRKRPHARLQAANPENSTFQPFVNPRTGTISSSTHVEHLHPHRNLQRARQTPCCFPKGRMPFFLLEPQ
jgi:hypothetical protein